jgi:hypothetical protein
VSKWKTARVTLEAANVADRDRETVVTTRVDGSFDRTGLPDPSLSTTTSRLRRKNRSTDERLAGNEFGTK